VIDVDELRFYELYLYWFGIGSEAEVLDFEGDEV